MSTVKNASREVGAPLAWRLPRWAGTLWTAICRRGVLVVGFRREHRGFIIRDARDHDHVGALVQRVADALCLIAELDERRLDRMRRLARRIVIVPTLGTDGEYWWSPRVLVVSEYHARNAPLERIAMTLVHEATHARLREAGIGYDAANRHRVERACIGEELAFARRLPEPEPWLEQASAKQIDPDHWSDEQMQQRRIRALRFWREDLAFERSAAADAGPDASV
jgi:hypothetical protein